MLPASAPQALVEILPVHKHKVPLYELCACTFVHVTCRVSPEDLAQRSLADRGLLRLPSGQLSTEGVGLTARRTEEAAKVLGYFLSIRPRPESHGTRRDSPWERRARGWLTAHAAAGDLAKVRGAAEHPTHGGGVTAAWLALFN